MFHLLGLEKYPKLENTAKRHSILIKNAHVIVNYSGFAQAASFSNKNVDHKRQSVDISTLFCAKSILNLEHIILSNLMS